MPIHVKWSQVLPEPICQKADAIAVRLQNERNQGASIFPSQENLFKALQETLPQNTKVCIIGQDPYHTPGAAHGLAFSIQNGKPIQPSLKNIFQKLQDDFPNMPAPTTSELTPWAKQGVLLLNASLSVYQGQPGSHANFGWFDFTKSILHTLMDMPQPVVFLLWGSFAQKIATEAGVHETPTKKLLISTHPSPFSANKATRTAPAFMDTHPFRDCNHYLEQMGSTPIQWQLP